MTDDVANDQLVLIRIEGMHCHRCEQTIQKNLARIPGVHEVEVDFPSGLASVLFDRQRVTIAELTETVTESGYQPMGFNQAQPDRVHNP